MSSPDYSQDVKDIIDGLGDTPTPDEIYHAVKNYSVDHVVAATASTAKAGGGGGGGGSLPWAYFASGGDTVPTATPTQLTWAKEVGDDLLDLTDPLNPLVVTAGVYAIMARTVPDGAHAGKFASLTLDGGDYRAGQGFPLDGTGATSPEGTCVIPFTFAAGAPVFATVAHDIGSDETFYLRAYVQKLA